MRLHQNAKTCPASRRLMCERVNSGWSVKAAAEAAGLTERRASEWLRRWRAGDRELEDRSSVAESIPGRTPPEVEEAILALRELRFSGTRIAESLRMPERTVRAVLARHGASKLPPVDAHEPKQRYERPAPEELIHIDVKKLGKIGRPGHRVNGDRSTPAAAGSAGSSRTSASTTAPAWPTSKCSPTNAPTPSSASWGARSPGWPNTA